LDNAAFFSNNKPNNVIWMSELLVKWVNDLHETAGRDISLSLSRPVRADTICSDFGNGYLFGNILFIFNQQPDFKEFSHQDTQRANINNWCRLYETFHTLDIKIDAKIASEAINSERGAIMKLLYAVHMAVKKISKKTPVSTKGATTAGCAPMHRAAASRSQAPQFKAQSRYNFEKRLREMLDGDNKRMDKRLMERFEAEGKAKEIEVEIARQEMERNIDWYHGAARQRTQQIFQNRRAQNMHDEQVGAQKWYGNMTNRKAAEQRDANFENRQRNGKYNKMVKNHKSAAEDVVSGIDDFEQKLANANGSKQKENNIFKHLDTPFAGNLRNMIAEQGLPSTYDAQDDYGYVESEEDPTPRAETGGFNREDFDLQVPVRLPQDAINTSVFQGIGSSIVSGGSRPGSRENKSATMQMSKGMLAARAGGDQSSTMRY
jgi:hypothetical protein